MQPQIVIQETAGLHNKQPNDRIVKGAGYKDASTICIVPTRGLIHGKVVQTWMNLWSPMNQKFMRMFVFNMEVGEAYNAAIEQILEHPELGKWKYILTLEEDNLPPPDGLIKLVESIQHFDVVGGLYWTKGECGQPMIYGDPYAMPLNFLPQVPQVDRVQPCCGLGMGFTLFRLSIFRDKRIPKPWFKTCQDTVNGCFTQDLYFFNNIHKLGFKIASDNRVRVGHYDSQNDIIW